MVEHVKRPINYSFLCSILTSLDFLIFDLYNFTNGFIMPSDEVFIPPANFVCGGYTVFTLSVRPSITFCFLNILKSNCWIFIMFIYARQIL